MLRAGWSEFDPVVLGGTGQVLDAGRARRLFVGSLRRVLEVRDHGCTLRRLRTGPPIADAHHILSWWGCRPTSLANGVLLCLRHHKEIHRRHWTVRPAADGRPE